MWIYVSYGHKPNSYKIAQSFWDNTLKFTPVIVNEDNEEIKQQPRYIPIEDVAELHVNLLPDLPVPVPHEAVKSQNAILFLP